jgi:hypothetical protein
MQNNAIIVFLALQATKKVSHWIFHLGAFGLIPLGILDASVVPLPGSMDVLTIVLATKQPDWWFINLSAGAQGRQGNAGEETFAQEHGASDQDF